MSRQFTKVAGACGFVAGLCGLLYLVAFFVLHNSSARLPSLLLLVSGIAATALLIGLYHRVASIDAGFAIWGSLLAVTGALGGAIHGAFDLSGDLHPPSTAYPYASAVDPRGFLTFFVAGLGTILLSWLLRRISAYRRVGILGMISGALLVLLYAAYLVLLNPANPLLVALIFATGVLQPLWNLWAGWLVWRDVR